MEMKREMKSWEEDLVDSFERTGQRREMEKEWVCVFCSTGVKTPDQPENMTKAEAEAEARRWTEDGYQAVAVPV